MTREELKVLAHKVILKKKVGVNPFKQISPIVFW